MNSIMENLTSIAIAIVGLATVAVIVSNRANTANVIKAASGGFSQAISAATAPVTGGGFGVSNMNFSL